MKKTTPFVIAGAAIATVGVAAAGAAAGCVARLSASRRKSIASIKKLSNYSDGYGVNRGRRSVNACLASELPVHARSSCA